LIQRLTLFLGYPTYSLTVTLFALLLSSGIGSLASERYGAPEHALRWCVAALAVIVVAYDFGLGALLGRGVGWPLEVRALTTVAVLAPLGLCLGAFMPLGLRFVASTTPHREAFVAWCWAVNGFFSVTSSVLAALLSIAFGFRIVMYVALAIYVVGVLALHAMPAANVRAPARVDA
jgi:MFS family permease